MSEIPLYNRATQCVEHEQVFKRGFMQWLYTHTTGLWLERFFFSGRAFSKLYGHWNNRTHSAQKRIQAFVQQYGINVQECEKPISDYQTFNAFFSRKLAPGVRTFELSPQRLVSPVDSRLLWYSIKRNTVIPIKGCAFTLDALIRNQSLAQSFHGGDCLVFRLAPVDYHRVHFIDDANQGEVSALGRKLHSVSPWAHEANLPIMVENKRQLCVLQTQNFGSVIHIDVGALAVGKIVQNLPLGGAVKRGDEKCRFMFGGSTVVLIFQKNCIRIDKDIAHYSQQGIETLVKLGEGVGNANRDTE